MYLWFLLSVLLNVEASSIGLCGLYGRSSYCRPTAARHYGPPHNYYKSDGTRPPITPSVIPSTPKNTFEDLAQNFFAAEAAIQQYCRDNSKGDVKEVFGIDSYILKYAFPGYDIKDVSVKIKHRVIYVTGEKPGVSFKDMRILPKIVNNTEASFALENALLKIFIPYNMVFRKESVRDCGEVSDAVINVPGINNSPMVPRTLMSKEEISYNDDDDLQKVLDTLWNSTKSVIDIRNNNGL